ncbi:queuosine precursor transporter [Candidatus Roizmanbacteria bacterium]|nr:queuosine precursor transporter [Candidatus Roizmanbacteria bacterium]
MKLKVFNLRINKLDLLISFYIFCILVSELMGGKTFPLIHIGNITLNASVAIFLIPFVFTINDSIIEVYGVERAKSIYRSGLFMIILLFLFAAFAVLLPPSARFAKTEKAYDLVFGQSIRIIVASLTAFAFSDFMDIIIFERLRKLMGKKALWLRNNVSNIISQFFDTTIFIVLAFYAFDKPLMNNAMFLISLITPYWLLKCFMSVIETPFVYIGVRWLRKK